MSLRGRSGVLRRPEALPFPVWEIAHLHSIFEMLCISWQIVRRTLVTGASAVECRRLGFDTALAYGAGVRPRKSLDLLKPRLLATLVPARFAKQIEVQV